MSSTTPTPWPAAQLALLQQLLADPSTPEPALKSIAYVINRVQGTAKRLGLKRQRKAPRAWPAAQLALLERLLADPATHESDRRSIEHLMGRVRGAAQRLSPKSEHQAPTKTGRMSATRAAALQAITAAEPHGIFAQDLLPLLPTRSGIANLHGLLSDLYAAQLVFRRKLGHRVLLHTSRQNCEAAALAQASSTTPAPRMPRAGSLRSEVVEAVIAAGAAGCSITELEAMPRFARYTRHQLSMAACKLLTVDALHSTGTQRRVRYFATAEQAKAHAATLPACQTNPLRRAVPQTGLQRAERRLASAEGAGRVALRQARKDAREANAVARQIRKQAITPSTTRPAPAAVATRPQARVEPIVPPGLKPTVVPPVRDTRYTADGPVRGGFFDQGIGRHSEPCRGWAQAVAAHIEQTERSA